MQGVQKPVMQLQVELPAVQLVKGGQALHSSTEVVLIVAVEKVPDGQGTLSLPPPGQ